MSGEKKPKAGKGKGDEIKSEMAEWMRHHPKATFREIEEEVDKQVAVLRAQLLSEGAVRRASEEWGGEADAVCPQCGAKLEKKGKKKRRLQTWDRQEVELEREYGVCPQCGQGFFPSG